MLKLILQRALILLTCIMLSACASQFSSSAAISIAPAASLNLNSMAPSMFGRSWQQVLFITTGQEQHTLLSQLAVNEAGGVKLLMMTSQGFPIVELEKLPKEPIKAKKMLVGVDINPAYVLADIALVHWPVAFINEQLSGALVEQVGTQRQVLQNHKTLITIDYNDDAITLHNIVRDYKIIFKKVTQ